MKIRIKKATAADINILLEWRMRVLREVFSLKEDENYSAILANNEKYYRKHLAEGNHTACFAVDGDSGKIIGCGGICYQTEMPSPDNLSGTNGYLMNIYTVPEIRGKGVGRMIVEFLIADAKQRGVEKIYLESSDIGKSLYREIGFDDMIGYMKLK